MSTETLESDEPRLGDMPMNGTSWAQSEYANRRLERTVTFPRWNAGPTVLGSEVSVTIICADPIFAAGLTAVLHECAGFQVIPTPATGDLPYGPPSADVVLADYETALRLAESAPQWAGNLVVFTNDDSEASICRAIESGARGYLLHGVSPAELFEGIRTVHGGGVALSPRVAARITIRVKSETLTPREKAVLEHLMLGLSNKEIARRLHICVGTVKTHVKSILGKLDAESRTAAVVAAHRRGLLP